jgi:hypothetical protein
MHKFWRGATECLVASLALASLTVICDRLHLNFTTVGLLYVIVVVLISRIGSLVSSIVVAIVATLCLAYVAPPAKAQKLAGARSLTIELRDVGGRSGVHCGGPGRVPPLCARGGNPLTSLLRAACG